MSDVVHISSPSKRDEMAQLEAYHKEFTLRLVLPVMGIVTIGYYVLLFRFEARILATIAIMLPFSAFNTWVTSKPRSIKVRGRTINLRSDGADALRWLVNLLLLDVLLVVSFGPPAPVLAGCWTLLLLSAQCDLFRKHYRNMVVGSGYVAALILLWTMTNETHTSRILTAAAMGAIIFIFGRMETYWMTALQDVRKAEQEAAEERIRSEQMEGEAMLGQQLQTVSHELNNLITIIDFATARKDKVDFERARRSVEFCKRINGIVLTGLARQKEPRSITARRMLDDVALLLRKETMHAGIEWVETFPQELGDVAITERPGATFFIIRNLVKNAREAVSNRWKGEPGGELAISVGREREGRVEVEVRDNGAGMDVGTLESLMSRRAQTSKDDGHGLGFRFVIDECERNGYELGVTSRPGEGTRVVVSMPVTPPGVHGPDDDDGRLAV